MSALLLLLLLHHFSRPTLCDPIDGSPPGSPVPGILQARTLEWVAISFSNAWKWKVKVKSLSSVWLLATPWTAAYQAPPSMGFSRQEYRNGVPLPSPCGVPLDTKQCPYCRVVGLEVFIDCFIWFILRIMFYLSSSMNSQDNTKFCEKQTYNLLIFFFIWNMVGFFSFFFFF